MVEPDRKVTPLSVNRIVIDLQSNVTPRNCYYTETKLTKYQLVMVIDTSSIGTIMITLIRFVARLLADQFQ